MCILRARLLVPHHRLNDDTDLPNKKAIVLAARRQGWRRTPNYEGAVRRKIGSLYEQDLLRPTEFALLEGTGGSVGSIVMARHGCGGVVTSSDGSLVILR